MSVCNYTTILKNICWCNLALGILLFTQPLQAIVLLNEGRITIDGITLLRDRDNPKLYYYLPSEPHISYNRQSKQPEMLLLKFINGDTDIAGSLIHFLFSLDLQKEEIAALTKSLNKEIKNARIAGMVDLQSETGKYNAPGKFELISSILSKDNKNKFTSHLITSGVSPLVSGTKSVVAAQLNRQGTVLLWDSLQQPTSDVSIKINASFIASVNGFKGIVEADIESVHSFFSKKVSSKEISRAEIGSLVNKLYHDGIIKVTTIDNSDENTDTEILNNVINTFSISIIDALFDKNTGFANLTKSKIADNHYVLRSEEKIRKGKFSIVLNKNIGIRVPLTLSGNIHNLYKLWKDNPSINRVVDVSDDFRRREVFFHINSAYTSFFGSKFDSVFIKVRKVHPTNMAKSFETKLSIKLHDVKKGKYSTTTKYALLGFDKKDAQGYEYAVVWRFRNGIEVQQPADKEQWIKGSNSVVSLKPPMDIKTLEFAVPSTEAIINNVVRIQTEIKYHLLGKLDSSVISLRPRKGVVLVESQILTDPNSSLEYRTMWYTNKNKHISQWQPLLEDVKYLSLPAGLVTEGTL